MSDQPLSAAKPAYRRVILKLSGESFSHAGERGISMEEVSTIAQQIQQAKELGCQLAIVIGGGNILRGAQFKDENSSIQEATAHYMGMLATVINGLALQDALESLGCETRLMSAIRMDGVAEPYIRRRARRHPSCTVLPARARRRAAPRALSWGGRSPSRVAGLVVGGHRARPPRGTRRALPHLAPCARSVRARPWRSALRGARPPR